jgi:hypothetical protein
MTYLDRTIQQELVQKEIPASNRPNYSDCFAVYNCSDVQPQKAADRNDPARCGAYCDPTFNLFCGYVLFRFLPFKTAGAGYSKSTSLAFTAAATILN